MSRPKKAFLLDTMSLIYRGYYAFIRNPLINKKGMNTSAIYGFMNIVVELLRREEPALIVAVMESEGPTFRHQLAADYKATRPPTPEPIEFALPYIRELLTAMGIPIVEVPGYEADDVIATLAHQLAHQGYEVYIVTSDKDLAQLVTDHIKLYRPGSRGGYEIWGPEEVKEKWGVAP